MALFDYIGRINMVDEHGLTGSKEVVIRVDGDDYVTVSERNEAASAVLIAFAEEFDDIIDPMITSVDLTLPLISSVATLKTSPGEQGVAEGANLKLTPFVVDPARPNRVLPYWLPGAKEGIFLPNFRDVDTSDTDLLQWVASFNGDPSARIVISDHEAIDTILSGRYATRRRDSNA